MARGRLWLLAALAACAGGCGDRARRRGRAPRAAGRARRRPPSAPARGRRPRDLAAPEGLRAVSGELRSVPLKWDPLLTGDVGGYVVERAAAREGRLPARRQPDRPLRDLLRRPRRRPRRRRRTPAAPTSATAPPTSTACAPSTRTGHVSRAASPVVTASTAPTPERARRAAQLQPPARARSRSPGGPLADPTGRRLRRLSEPERRAASYLPIARIEGRYTTTFVDRGLAPLRVFYYRVAAVNAAGGEGVPTRALRGVTKPEPLPPAALHVVSRVARRGAPRLGAERRAEPRRLPRAAAHAAKARRRGARRRARRRRDRRGGPRPSAPASASSTALSPSTATGS